ncbi:MAG: cyclic pyranopterin monophosphate synthase MoaC [Armatimonadota bacterium]|nr:cyclic pyranopterin monophosphate synthase MoaC [bacterium]MDW8320313.1 cyclic pyranopterin monophosphate synthase MoaC [Armatimonadota bacterium]
MAKLSHIDEQGEARMVDVSAKGETVRTATAQAVVRLSPRLLELVRTHSLEKGDVLAVARVAGVMAAKRVGEIIPLCHPLPITHADVQFEFLPEGLRIVASASVVGRTGVEMEALTAASVAALTVYDMCKAVDRGITITDICLLEKAGGKSGTYRREGGENRL